MNLKKRYSIIETFFHEPGYNALFDLTPNERLFAYYMSRAAIAGYPIALRQYCPFPSILEKILSLINTLSKNELAGTKIYDELKIYWIYLFVNYGVHSRRGGDKKTPDDLGLLFTRKDLSVLGQKFSFGELKYIFDKDYFPVSKVDGNIEESGNAFHEEDMTTNLYNKLISEKDKLKLNAYHIPYSPSPSLPSPKGDGGAGDGDEDEGGSYSKVMTMSYSSKEYCASYVRNCVTWIRKALNHILFCKEFDIHTIVSLALLIKYLETGDEKYFRDHSKAWLRMNNRVEYCFGFIEYYDDPMGHIGTFQADVTVKAISKRSTGGHGNSLLELLPTFEKRFPFPSPWKRENMTNIPNAATAHKITGIGFLGPVSFVVAYCLPNYSDITSQLGSKQIMYTTSKPSDIKKYMKIFMSDVESKFFKKYSPNLELDEAISSLLVTLHETIGHASGSIISGFTSKKRNALLGEWGNALEEMKAEIIALYTAVTFMDEICEAGIFEKWNKKVNQYDLKYLCIKEKLNKGWMRWVHVKDTRVKGAHALANTAIMYYLLDKSNVKLTKEEVEVDGEPLTVLRVTDFDICDLIPHIKELAYTVQRFSSTVPVHEIDAFMRKYAMSTRNSEYGAIVKNMRDVYNNGVEIKSQVFVDWIPVKRCGVSGLSFSPLLEGLFPLRGNNLIDAIPSKPVDPFTYYSEMFKKCFTGLE